MASHRDVVDQRPNGVDGAGIHDQGFATPVQPSTPQDTTGPVDADSSQVALPSTEDPLSPIDPSSSFKTEVNDDRPVTTVIPSSLTPPPSSQIPAPSANAHHRRGGLAPSQSQQSNIFSISPPPTVLPPAREAKDGAAAGSQDWAPPPPEHITTASPDELRALLQTCVAENQKLKMETAHHKLQYSLLSMQTEEDAKRATVEHDMIRREVDALRTAEHTRQARRELGSSSESLQAKYLQARTWHEEAMEENEVLQRRVKVAKKVIQQKEEDVISLTEERDMLLNRIRENREHFHVLCSPGGMFHGAVLPKIPGMTSPQQLRSTPKNSRASQREDKGDREHGLSALLQAMSQDNNSAPSTPFTSFRSAPRQAGGKHSRNAQSMSSLPTTPVNRPRGEHASLLPSADLVPQTEPAQRYTKRSFGDQRRGGAAGRRKSRESTISAEDNEELARQALESVAAVQSMASQASQQSRGSRSRHSRDGGEDEDVHDSQATQAATEMLRRDPRQSFEVASSVGSRDATPGPAEKSARMQSKLLSNVRGTGGGTDKRKFSGGGGDSHDERLREQGSPTKKMRVGGPLLENPRVGLGIQYSQ